MKVLEEYTLSEIIALNDKKEYEKYYCELEELKKMPLSQNIIKRMQGSSLEKIMEEILRKEEEIKSYSLFPGNLVEFYPNKKELHTKKIITCDFSGAPIMPGSLYINYRPLIANITTNEVYVLSRTIKVECGYAHSLPSDIQEFEELERKMQLEQDFNDEIKYSHLNQVTGGSLKLQKLKRRNK